MFVTSNYTSDNPVKCLWGGQRAESDFLFVTCCSQSVRINGWQSEKRSSHFLQGCVLPVDCERDDMHAFGLNPQTPDKQNLRRQKFYLKTWVSESGCQLFQSCKITPLCLSLGYWNEAHPALIDGQRQHCYLYRINRRASSACYGTWWRPMSLIVVPNTVCIVN